KETGIVVVWRPMDLLDKAKWADGCRTGNIKTGSNEAGYIGVKGQIIDFRGLELSGDNGKARKYKHPDDFSRIPWPWLNILWNLIQDRMNISEDTEKNSEPPSGSEVLSGSVV